MPPPRQDAVLMARSMSDAQRWSFAIGGAKKAVLYSYLAQVGVRVLPTLVIRLFRSLATLARLAKLQGTVLGTLQTIRAHLAAIVRKIIAVIAASGVQCRLSVFLGILCLVGRLAVTRARQQHGIPSKAVPASVPASEVASAPALASAPVSASASASALVAPVSSKSEAGPEAGPGGHSDDSSAAEPGAGCGEECGTVDGSHALSTALQVSAAATLGFMVLPRDNRVGIALFVGVRAAEVLIRHLHRVGYLPYIPNAYWLSMAMASGEIVHSAVFQHGCLEPGYRKWLEPFIGLSVPEVDLLGKTYAADFTWTDMRSHPAMADAVLPLQGPQSVVDMPCYILHPSTTCTSSIPPKIRECVRKAFFVYAPLQLLQLFVFRRGKLLKEPLPVLERTARTTLRSTAFLATYSCAAWIAHCFFHATLRWHHMSIPFICGAIGGSSIMIEPASRRPELALYTTGQAIRSVCNRLVRAGMVPPVPGIELLLFACSVTVLCRSFLASPSDMRRSYRGLLGMLVGDP